MPESVGGSLALVAGGSSGIGLQVAKSFAAAGARVLLVGRDEARLCQAAEAVGPGTMTCVADLSDAAGEDQLAEALRTAGTPRYVIHCIGKYAARPFDEITDAEWSDYFQTNVMSAVRLVRAVAPGMKRANAGSIVIVSSEAAIRSVGLMAHYSTTKTALLGLSRALAEGFRGTGIRVNSYLPGPTATDAIADYFASIAVSRGQEPDQAIADFFDKDQPGSLLGRLIDPADHAEAILLLARTPAMNGTAMRADGGAVHAIL